MMLSGRVPSTLCRRSFCLTVVGVYVFCASGLYLINGSLRLDLAIVPRNQRPENATLLQSKFVNCWDGIPFIGS